MKNVTPILAMIATALVTLTMLVFCMAMGANSTPEQIRSLKRWMLGLSLLGAAGIGSGIYLLRIGQITWATGISVLPAVLMVIICLVALTR